MHVVWHWRFLLCLRPLLPGRQRTGISISGLDYCDIFRRAAFRLGRHGGIPGADAFSLNETAGVRGAHDDLAVCLNGRDRLSNLAPDAQDPPVAEVPSSVRHVNDES